ncbi:hypothetical protein Metme_3381 [Methylomonas methanica MC09]|uniref:Uncharacterized protein n=1 Tax=Methylomonas methanica (strain DSM 25384 / MC09) TaxID=857087 RepID=G0A6C4_METMM|nr:hypothetical protein Metme_3381 [Methylomonas methanica MC09]
MRGIFMEVCKTQSQRNDPLSPTYTAQHRSVNLISKSSKSKITRPIENGQR